MIAQVDEREVLSDAELESIANDARWKADRLMPSDLDALRAVSRAAAVRVELMMLCRLEAFNDERPDKGAPR